MSTQTFTLRAGTHQADIKKLPVTKANCYVASHHLHLTKKMAFEHIAKTRARHQLAHTFCE